MSVRLKITALTLLARVLGAPVARAGAWPLIAESPNGQWTIDRQDKTEFRRICAGNLRKLETHGNN